MKRLLLITVFTAILVAVFIFSYYNPLVTKRDFDKLYVQENNIISRSGQSKDQFRFCAYPSYDTYAQISWDETDTHSEGKAIRMFFKQESSQKQYLGIHLFLTLAIRPYLDKGTLEFWIKGINNFSSVEDMNIYMKEGPNKDRMVQCLLPIKISKNWQRFNVFLNQFSVVKVNGQEDDKNQIPEEMQEFLFSINASNLTLPPEIIIDDLKIKDGDEIIYEIF